MTYPQDGEVAPESALQHYLARARDLLAWADPAPVEVGRARSEPLSAEFDRLRWFELPPVCLT